MISFYNVAAIIGLLTIISIAFKIVQVLQFIFHSSQLQRYNHPPRNNNSKSTQPTTKAWALVTGASDGIGHGFAQELSARNFNVILHGRNEEKLKKVQAELQNASPTTEFRILVMDAAVPISQDFDQRIIEAFKDINLTVLVNNVGGSGGVEPIFKLMGERTGDELDRFINVNATFMAHLTRVLIPQLVRNGPSLVLNVSSGAEEIPSPYLAAYAASKAFMSAWTRSLQAEMVCEGHDVEFMSLVVGVVATKSSGRSLSDVKWDMPSPRTMAAAALDKVGCGYHKVSPYWGHALQMGVVGYLPESLKSKFAIKITLGVMKAMKEKGI